MGGDGPSEDSVLPLPHSKGLSKPMAAFGILLSEQMHYSDDDALSHTSITLPGACLRRRRGTSSSAEPWGWMDQDPPPAAAVMAPPGLSPWKPSLSDLEWVDGVTLGGKALHIRRAADIAGGAGSFGVRLSAKRFKTAAAQHALQPKAWQPPGFASLLRPRGSRASQPPPSEPSLDGRRAGARPKERPATARKRKLQMRPRSHGGFPPTPPLPGADDGGAPLRAPRPLARPTPPDQRRPPDTPVSRPAPSQADLAEPTISTTMPVAIPTMVVAVRPVVLAHPVHPRGLPTAALQSTGRTNPASICRLRPQPSPPSASPAMQ